MNLAVGCAIACLGSGLLGWLGAELVMVAALTTGTPPGPWVALLVITMLGAASYAPYPAERTAA